MVKFLSAADVGIGPQQDVLQLCLLLVNVLDGLATRCDGVGAGGQGSFRLGCRLWLGGSLRGLWLQAGEVVQGSVN